MLGVCDELGVVVNECGVSVVSGCSRYQMCFVPVCGIEEEAD